MENLTQTEIDSEGESSESTERSSSSKSSEKKSKNLRKTPAPFPQKKRLLRTKQKK